MTSKRPESISDDWEELDAVSSVVSFDTPSRPTSPAPLGEQTPATVSPNVQGHSNTIQLVLRPKDDKAVDTRLSSTTTGPILDTAQRVASSESHSTQPSRNDDTVPTPGNLTTSTSISSETRNLIKSWSDKAWTQPPSDQEQKDVECDDQVTYDTGHNQDRWDGNTNLVYNPIVYHDTCNEAIATLRDVANLSHDIGGHRISTLSMIRQTCERLWIQTTEIQRMLVVYRSNRKVWASAEIPLSPDLLELLTRLRDGLCKAKAELERLKPDEGVVLQAQDIPVDVNLRLARCGEGLGEFSSTIADFLPIMRADFDEISTKNMAFQPATTGSVQSPRCRIPPNPNVSRVRKELYDLKDCLVSMSNFLKEVNTDPVFDWTIDPSVTNSVDSVVDVITKILTNHPSEWIESNMAVQGGLTYQHFVELDSEIIHDVYLQLKSHKDELDMVPDEDGALFSWKKVRDYQVDQLAHGGMLEAIISLIEFVKQLLLIDE